MLFRRGLLVLGAGALVVGLALIALWLRSSSPVEQARHQPRTLTVLVAVHDLSAGTLLRAEDTRWRRIPADDAMPGAIEAGRASRDSLIGAALRRAVAGGGVLEMADIVQPDQPGFLPAVLRPGMRADTIPVGRRSGAVGLIAPGDHVDVILIQIFNGLSVAPTRRSVGETILHDLRVLAVDQNVGAKPTPPAPAPAEHLAGSNKNGPHLPQSVTVELTPRQAQVLAVASRLGELQLTLRSVGVPAPGQWRPSAAPPPTWAEQASPALRQLESDLPIARSSGGALPRPGSQVEVMHGSKTQQRCFNASTGISVDCGTITQPSRSETGAAPAVRRPAGGPAS